MDAWFQLSLEIPSDLSDVVCGMLFDLGSAGLQVEGGTDVRCVRLTAYFPACEDREQVVGALRSGLHGLARSGGPQAEGPGEVRIGVAEVPREDWATAWRQHFRPVYPTPRMAVCPPWDRVPDPEGGFAVVVEPKTAFGTGHHETTRMALQAMEQRVQAGGRVLDVGTGSGILSIAAAKLGAGGVTAVDTDPQAVENARQNASLNAVGERMDLYEGSVSAVEDTFDLVVANVISGVLIPMLPDLKARLKASGRLILGGVLVREEAGFLGAVGEAGLAVEEVLRDGEWVCIVARHESKSKAGGNP